MGKSDLKHVLGKSMGSGEGRPGLASGKPMVLTMASTRIASLLRLLAGPGWPLALSCCSWLVVSMSRTCAGKSHSYTSHAMLGLIPGHRHKQDSMSRTCAAAAGSVTFPAKLRHLIAGTILYRGQ